MNKLPARYVREGDGATMIEVARFTFVNLRLAHRFGLISDAEYLAIMHASSRGRS